MWGEITLRALIIGVGQCGTKIADLFALVDFEALAINTSKSDLDYLKHIPKERRILIGESLTGGKGVNANPICLLYTSPSPRDISGSRMPSSA